MLSFILGKTYSWGTSSVVFDKHMTIITPWGSGKYQCIDTNKLTAQWNGYDHTLTFNKFFTEYSSISSNNISGSGKLLTSMPLTSYLNLHNYYKFEGYSDEVPGQVTRLTTLTSKPGISLLEIGFNAGHSSDNFLRNNKTLTMTSFDLGEHRYGTTAKEYIDSNYPGRHTLILGDSTTTVPEFIKKNNGLTFDVIFIDGGHTYDIAKSDLENCRSLSTKDTLLLVDDVVKEWPDFGPTKIWNEMIKNKEVIELGREEYKHGRAMVWGRYS